MEPEILPQQKTDNTTTETDSTTVIYLEESTRNTPINEDIDYDILRVFYAAGF